MVETRGGRRLAVFFFFAAFLILFLSRWLQPVDNFALSIAAPFNAVISGIANGVSDGVSGVVDGPRLQNENSRLKKQVGILLNRNILLQTQAHENQIFRRMLGYDNINQHMQLMPGRTIGTDPNSLGGDILIDRGSRAGVREGMTVVDPDGYFVGSIVQVTPRASKVLLMISPSSSVGAMDLRTHARGVVEGVFDGRPQLHFVNTSAALRPGDFVVTSGDYELYPANILLGQIMNVRRSSVSLFQHAEITPAARFNNLEMIQVVRSFVPSLPNKLITP